MQQDVEWVRDVLEVIEDRMGVEMVVMDTTKVPSQSLAHAETTLLEHEDVQLFDF